MNETMIEQAQGQNKAIQTNETASTAVAAQARAIIEARYLMAKHQPRDMDLARQRILKECARPGFAEAAKYSKPVGESSIVGPSIRFAEAAIRCLGNIDISCMTVYDDAEKRIVRVCCTDLESNHDYSQDVTIQKTVERKNPAGYEVVSQRTNKQNQIVYIVRATDDDILNKQNALISKAIRTLGLRLVPGDIIDEAMDAVAVTQSKRDAVDPDAARKKLLDAFSAVGVPADEVKRYLGHDCGTLDPKELSDLRALYSAIKDGETTWREVMDGRNADGEKSAEPIGKGAAGLKAAIGKKAEAPTELLAQCTAIIGESGPMVTEYGIAHKWITAGQTWQHATPDNLKTIVAAGAGFMKSVSNFIDKKDTVIK
jgi:hypothetical protein